MTLGEMDKNKSQKNSWEGIAGVQIKIVDLRFAPDGSFQTDNYC